MCFAYHGFSQVYHLLEHSTTSQDIFQKNAAALVTHIVKGLAKT